MSSKDLRLEVEMMKAQLQQQMQLNRYELGLGNLGLRPGGMMYVRDGVSVRQIRPRCMSKHCVSCGAPPETTTTVCSYCGTQEKQ